MNHFLSVELQISTNLSLPGITNRWRKNWRKSRSIRKRANFNVRGRRGEFRANHSDNTKLFQVLSRYARKTDLHVWSRWISLNASGLLLLTVLLSSNYCCSPLSTPPFIFFTVLRTAPRYTHRIFRDETWHILKRCACQDKHLIATFFCPKVIVSLCQKNPLAPPTRCPELGFLTLQYSMPPTARLCKPEQASY